VAFFFIILRSPTSGDFELLNVVAFSIIFDGWGALMNLACSSYMSSSSLEST